jgi:Lrp/AsnC family transcriptional regulator for asnA, asnC and gidA
LRNARKSFSKIAEECKVSVGTISDRYAELESAGIIVGSTLQWNYRSLGYDVVCDMSIRVEPEKIDEVIAYVQKMPNMYQPGGVEKVENPQSNVSAIAILKNLRELDKTKDAIRRSKFVKDIKTRIWTDIRCTPENLEILPGLSTNNVENPTSISLSTKSRVDTIDEIDTKIIEKLSGDSRQSFSKIAQQIGTSLDTVSRRYKKLEENGIIKALIQIDPSKIGYHAFAQFSLAFDSQNSTFEVIKRLSAIRDTTHMIKTSGDYDLIVSVMTKDIDQLLAVHKEIAFIAGLTRLETTLYPIFAPFPSPREYITTF